MVKTKIAVLASGSGTNLQSIIDNMELGELPVEIMCVISDNEKSFALERSKKHNIPAYFIDKKDKKRAEHEKEVVAILKEHGVELVVLAGYMRIITSYFINEFKNKIINIHPALLPSFAGSDGYGDAWKYGVKVSGCTVHFVDEGCDTGPIILQAVNPIKADDTFESFKERGLKIEHKAFPEAIKLYCEGRLKIEGRKVVIK